MTIGISFSQDVFFGPDEIRAMGAAFDRACTALPGQPDIVKEIIAKRIIELARAGDGDPDHLCDVALNMLGYDRSSS